MADESGGLAPPNANADVLPNVDEQISDLATFKSLTSVQLKPFQDSVTAVTAPGVVLPPNAKAAG